ncbi:MAG: aspartate-semialdehyde dehydrogenase [Deltaproteobacteria bacterium]|jgi:aspartate-semialdehyde dehydrogenase|nr:aspartate-semialdehyde dehydrogenase [Deltaproteobacteria bacterium]MDH3899043.1 aspartate-semialdehyde dehydrogenase [Deltaproteobacteria bacterium]MDH3927311.1 aspartate-semialdehyde dehydrogenase [Deltaproteobacteria bacterium]MDH3964052.1 aspartate-semialdehyde dehydrogenase [Deltaproteobacteria bacterium]PNV84428.1 MAG: aspartate-semialdehyde dehydrogenase [Desulfobacteraceae bacterium]
MKSEYHVAVAGATGAVGNEMLRILEEQEFPVASLKLLASSRSAGKTLDFRGESLHVEELRDDSFEGVDIALFSAGAAASRQFAPAAAESGCVVIDNSSGWRMDPEVPLVVPEVNPHAVADYRNKGIIANPNCSTIQMVVVLKPIYDAAGIERVVVSTYQAVSGTGKNAMEELTEQTRNLLTFQEVTPEVYPHRIAFNCFPHIGSFLENGYTEEEMKMVHETHKIMEDPNIRVSATTVRIPVFYGHSEAVNIQTKRKLSAKEARVLLFQAPGVRVMDNPDERIYPMPSEAAGINDTLVGRIREDISIENGLDLWIVADNIRKGAALNTVQIAELLIKEHL